MNTTQIQADLLKNKVALVTGAGRGIGRACTEALAAAGARVIAVDLSQADLDSLKECCPALIDTWQEDVTADAFYLKIEALSRLDILINNAGMNKPQAFTEVDNEILSAMLKLNVEAAFRTAQCATRVMLRENIEGSIINMSSQMGHVGSPSRTVYCMTKHAIEGLTKAMAVELAPHGIRVNAIAPTFVETPMTKPMFEEPVFRKFVMDRIPLGRIGQVEDVAEAVLFLASSRSSMITGDSLKVDGGWTAQ
ncbi:MAG: SDR family oxidoreductase [Anaerolineae bacterium]|nr:SDR family oxidoreductase [Pseudomonadota bacterium]MDK1029861.1 SDR family oxidoreductase [Anaerolineae bacterium]